MDYIKTKKRGIYRIGILDEDDKPVLDANGKEVCLEFDLEDIDLPLRYNKCVQQIDQARKNLKNQFIIIEKKQDFKKKKEILSNNEKEKVKAMQKFYVEMEKTMDMFLGEGGTKKYLNGRKPYWEMFDDLTEALDPFLPQLQLTVSDMTDRIKSKYKVQENDVMKDE